MIRTRWFTSRSLASARLIALAAVALVGACRTDITTVAPDQAVVGKIFPEFAVDTSFVGDTVVSNLPYFTSPACDVDFASLMSSINLGHRLAACTGLGNFDLAWVSSDPAVSLKVGGGAQHVQPAVDIQLVRFASVGTGQAVHGFGISGVRTDAGIGHHHTIVVLPAPDRLDVPDFLVLAIGESTLLTATVHAGTGPRVTSGTLVLGPASSVASITPTDSSLSESDGRRVTKPTMSFIVKGLTQGQLVVPVSYKKSTSTYDAAGALAAPAMFQKNVTILVGASVRIVALGAPPNDPLTPVTIGYQRSYRLLDQNDEVVPTQFWSVSSNNIAFISTTGVATCLAAGTVTVTATKPLTSLSASTTLTCLGTFALNVLTAPLSVTAGAQPPVLDTVQITRTSFPAAITLTAVSDPGITIAVTPATTTGSLFELSISAASNVSLGVHSVSLTATGGAAPVTKTFAIEVKAPVVTPPPNITLAIDPKTVSISAGRQSTLSAVVTGGLNVTDVTWTTKDASIATIAANGSRSVFVNGVKAGSSTYVVGSYAYSGGTLRDSALVTVTAASTAQVDHITLEPDSTDVVKGQQVQYRVRYWNASNVEMNAEVGATISFSEDVSSVAQIDATTGLLTTRGVGSTPVTASYRMPYYSSLSPAKASLIAKAKVVVH